jgi:hypothetical protein
MKILCVNSVISEHGGAEFAATNLAYGLADRGHEIHFLGAKGQKPRMQPLGRDAENLKPERGGKIHLHHREFPRIYPLGEKHGNLRKLIWHVQDLAHPANEAIFADVLNQVQPNAIILHNITAVGVNIWRTIGISRVPKYGALQKRTAMLRAVRRLPNSKAISILHDRRRSELCVRFTLAGHVA